MLKRRIGISFLLVCALTVVAVLTKLSLYDSGATAVRTVEDIEQIPFVFLGVYDDNWKTAGERIYYEASIADAVLLVRPTERAELHGYAVLQEVEIVQNIRSQAELPDKIWIETDNGFFYSPESHGNTLINWGIDNIMFPDWEYLVFLNEYDCGRDIYFNEFVLGTIRLSEDADYKVIDINRTYTYGELKSYEFFADSVEMLDILYEIKENLLSTYLKF